MKNFVIPLMLQMAVALVQAQQPAFIVSAPAGELYTTVDEEGKTVIPNGRFITPAGRSYEVAPHPYGLAISSDGKSVVTVNSACPIYNILIYLTISILLTDIHLRAFKYNRI